jgi:hypothetical protein
MLRQRRANVQAAELARVFLGSIPVEKFRLFRGIYVASCYSRRTRLCMAYIILYILCCVMLYMCLRVRARQIDTREAARCMGVYSV